MFGFGWVITHFGVVFYDVLDCFRVFGCIYEKNGRNQKILGNFGGPTPRRRDPHAVA